MRVPTLRISEAELLEVVVEVAHEGVAWLDASGSGELGRRSHLAFGPSVLSVARFGDGDPLRLFGERPRAGVGAPDALASIVAVAYDAAWSAPQEFGLRRPPRLRRDPSMPVAFRRDFAAALVYDHERGEARLGAESEAALTAAAQRLEQARRRRSFAPAIRVGEVAAEPPERHLRRIEAALEAIARGDLYQVNLARPFVAAWSGDPLALALAMRRASPVPLGAFVEGPDGLALVARTMELFLSITPDGRIESRPIKGTVPEGEGAAVALLASAKERAEHAMIVDLMRNDLGRIATPGTVRTPKLFSVEPYAHLRHLVSVVEARLPDGVALSDVLGATFPPASISGAPKIAALEHIEALEDRPRSFYTGTLGGMTRDGAVMLAVAIRTAELDRSRGELSYFAGGGIVSASDASAELAETDLKARAFLDAVDALGPRF